MKNFNNIKASQIMTATPLTTTENMRLSEAESYMKEKKVGALIVVDGEDKVVGILQIFD